MTAYMIVNVDVHDPQGYEEYKAKVPALIAKHGGEYIVRGGEFEVLEGNWEPNRLIIFSFPDRQAIHSFMTDPEYADLKALRQRIARSSVVAVDGVN